MKDMDMREMGQDNNEAFILLDGRECWQWLPERSEIGYLEMR
jgi:hypothetical protein